MQGYRKEILHFTPDQEVPRGHLGWMYLLQKQVKSVLGDDTCPSVNQKLFNFRVPSGKYYHMKKDASGFSKVNFEMVCNLKKEIIKNDISLFCRHFGFCADAPDAAGI